MNENGEKRPWLAAALAVVYPGLGHLYLGLWGRALLWSGTAVLAGALFVPPDAAVVAREQGLVALGASLSPTTLFALASVTVMAAIDAYWHATRSETTADDVCPECGKELDEDLSFCQWCTAEFEEPGAG